MFVPWKALNGKHQATVMCAKGAKHKIKRLMEEEVQASTAVAFQAHGRHLETVAESKCLGRSITASDDNCKAVVANIQKARSR